MIRKGTTKQRRKLGRKRCYCRHTLADHTQFVGNKTNAKGSRYVCTKDGCSRWNQCDL